MVQRRVTEHSAFPHLIMPRPKNPDRYHKQIASHGLEATITERSNGRLYLMGTIAGERVRQSLGTDDPVIAETRARETLAAIQRRLLRLAEPALSRTTDITIGEVFDAWRRMKRSDYTPREARTMDQRASFLGKIWGLRTPVAHLDQDAVDKAAKAVLRRGTVGSTTTARHYLADVSTIFSWATRKKTDGTPLLANNPISGLRLPPRAKDAARPVASHSRFLMTLRAARGTPSHLPGAVVTALVIARYQGRRKNAIRQLQWSDVCLTHDVAAKRLADHGLPPEIASFWPHGAIVWRAETDKLGQWSVVPLHRVAARALCYHRRRCERLGRLGRWLFPSPVLRDRPISIHTFDMWLRRAERSARQAGSAVYDVAGGMWHPYRRLWRGERARFPEKAVALLGGWTTHSDGWRAAMNGGYLPVPAPVLARVIDASPDCSRNSIGTGEDLLWHYEGWEMQW